MDRRPSPFGRWGRVCRAFRFGSTPTIHGQVLAASAAAAALGMGCSPAVAQMAGLPTFGISAPQVTPGSNQLQFGPNLELGFDNNVARSSAEVAAERGLKPQDFFVLPSGDVSFTRAFGRETIFLQAQAGYQAYARNSILDRENISIDGGGVGRLGVCDTTLSGAYTRGQANIDYLVISAQGKLAPTVKDARQDSIIDFTGICGRSIGFAPTFNVSETWLTNSSQLYALIDSHIFSGSGGIAYRNPVLGQVSVTGQYSKVDYPNRIIPFIGPAGLEEESYGLRTLGGGITYLRQVGRLTGTVQLSYEKLEPTVPIATGFSGLTYDVNLGYALTPRMTVTALVGKETLPSNELQSSFSITSLYGVQASYAFGPQMSAELGYSHAHQQYGGFVVPATNNLTEQTTNDIFGSVSRQLNHWLRVGTNLSYARRDANFVGLSYSDVILTITARSVF